MRVEVWSDVVCPWCYIGKRRLEAAIAAFDGDVEVHWRSFELDPNAPRSLATPLTEMLARKYGMSVERARQMQDHVATTAAADGLDFHFDKARTGNTFDAHRLIHHAKSKGHGAEMKERLLAAYFTEGRAISDHTELSALAGEIGLDATEAAEVLASGAYAEDVRKDERQAHAYGARGVPFFVIDGRYGVSGAQPAETLLQVLRQARAEAPQPVEAAPGCDDDGCAV